MVPGGWNGSRKHLTNSMRFNPLGISTQSSKYPKLMTGLPRLQVLTLSKVSNPLETLIAVAWCALPNQDRLWLIRFTEAVSRVLGDGGSQQPQTVVRRAENPRVQALREQIEKESTGGKGGYTEFARKKTRTLEQKPQRPSP